MSKEKRIYRQKVIIDNSLFETMLLLKNTKGCTEAYSFILRCLLYGYIPGSGIDTSKEELALAKQIIDNDNENSEYTIVVTSQKNKK